MTCEVAKFQLFDRKRKLGTIEEYKLFLDFAIKLFFVFLVYFDHQSFDRSSKVMKRNFIYSHLNDFFNAVVTWSLDLSFVFLSINSNIVIASFVSKLTGVKGNMKIFCRKKKIYCRKIVQILSQIMTSLLSIDFNNFHFQVIC